MMQYGTRVVLRVNRLGARGLESGELRIAPAVGVDSGATEWYATERNQGEELGVIRNRAL